MHRKRPTQQRREETNLCSTNKIRPNFLVYISIYFYEYVTIYDKSLIIMLYFRNQANVITGFRSSQEQKRELNVNPF